MTSKRPDPKPVSGKVRKGWTDPETGETPRPFKKRSGPPVSIQHDKRPGPRVEVTVIFHEDMLAAIKAYALAKRVSVNMALDEMLRLSLKMKPYVPPPSPEALLARATEAEKIRLAEEKAAAKRLAEELRKKK